MTLEQAVERVEKILAQRAEIERSFPSHHPNDKADAEALRILLARAKEPKVYALGDLDRMFLRRLEYAGEELTRDHESDCECPDCEETRALTAALALEKPKEPRVTIEYRGRAKPKPFYSDEYVERVKRE